MNNDIGDQVERFINNKGTKVKVTKELQAVGNAMNAYVQANGGRVVIAASFIAFDEEKLEAKADDVIADGSDRVFAFGDLEGLRISLEALRNEVEDSVDEDGFVVI